ncbi:MAG: filamentous hemagglutinin N-terminal domain-containing protein [Verrucomicrobia bacterium]|nr:filamentous hemagglutinin N-terminal domain-containing protein [Verrucomicrobiota bacterium]
MKTIHIFQKILCACGRVMPGFVFLLLARESEANPTGLTVVSGSATTQASGSQLNITASQNAVLNWSSFNIAAGERTTFIQPSATSVVFNHITDQNPSQIYGSLQANGIVVLLNASGFYFGPNSYVSAGGLMISTANMAPPENSGGAWQFNGPPPLVSIVNYGQIKIGHGGDCFFIADKVENHGSVEAPGGNISFAAGQTVTLSERPDGRGMSMQVTLPQGSVDNYGNVIADGGTIALNAKVVNQNGFIQANSVQNNNGVIELVASDTLSLGANSAISAKGDDSAAGSAGGTVTLKSDNIFSDATGSQIVTTGGGNGGNGGNVEVSAPNIQSLNSSMDASASVGFTGGEFLLDPVNIVLGLGIVGTVPANGTVPYNTPGTLNLNVGTGGSFANKNFSNIKLQASGNITMDAGVVWDLSGSTGNKSGQVTLQAGGQILLNDGAQIFDANNWSLTMQAGYDFINNRVKPYINSTPAPPDTSIILDGSSSIKLAAGAINLTAGKDITVNSGYVITTGGGSISAHALSGTIITGEDPIGYYFNPNATTIGSAYDLSHGLGGISTAAGGSVLLTAGGDVISYLPTTTDKLDALTAGAGAYGKDPGQSGDVTVIAGGNVTGHYLVANGTGSIFAGVKMDANGNPVSVAGKYVLGPNGNAGNTLNDEGLALSLITGGWNVTTAQNINLQEVRNPNGLFNNTASSPLVAHVFDYAQSDYVKLTAGNQVQLGGGSLPRTAGPVPMIYPGILNIMAGAGGVVFNGAGGSTYGKLILFPSLLGSLVIDTTGGGSLVGKLPKSGVSQLFDIVMSDHYIDPLDISTWQFDVVSGNTFGANDHAATPVHLNSEQPVQLNISGNMNLMRLFVPEAAQINVVGNMNNSRFQGMNLDGGDVTSITVGQAAKVNMENSGILNPATDGSLIVGGDILNPATGVANGYTVGGGGEFDITARIIDLGTTAGIISAGVGLYNINGYYPLAQLFNTGANLVVNASGNLNLVSSSIASFNGSDIYVNADGNINVGTALGAVQTFGPRGIFSTGQGNVAVYAGGNIDVEGSRIAVYDTRTLLPGIPAAGGSLTVVSRHGDVIVGAGGTGFVQVFSYFVDPLTHQVTAPSPTIPGTGILVTSFNRDGNMLVEALNGNVNIGVGGISQALLKGGQTALNTDQVATLFRLALEGDTAAARAYEILINGTGNGAPVSFVDVYAGYGLEMLDAGHNPILDPFGNPMISAINLAAGTLVKQSAGNDITADGAGVVSAGNLDVKASGNINGNFASTGGNVGGAGFAASSTAGNAAAGVGNEDTAKAATKSEDNTDDDLKKKKKGIALAQKVSRVTVILPKKN